MDEYTDLTTNDYKTILNFYKVPIPSSPREIKKQAEYVIGNKLCRCIQKVTKRSNVSETRAIGTCTRSVINRKGYVRKTFKCKRKVRRVTLKKKGTRKKSKNKKRRINRKKNNRNTTRKNKSS